MQQWHEKQLLGELYEDKLYLKEFLADEGAIFDFNRFSYIQRPLAKSKFGHQANNLLYATISRFSN